MKKLLTITPLQAHKIQKLVTGLAIAIMLAMPQPPALTGRLRLYGAVGSESRPGGQASALRPMAVKKASRKEQLFPKTVFEEKMKLFRQELAGLVREISWPTEGFMRKIRWLSRTLSLVRGPKMSPADADFERTAALIIKALSKAGQLNLLGHGTRSYANILHDSERADKYGLINLIQIIAEGQLKNSSLDTLSLDNLYAAGYYGPCYVIFDPDFDGSEGEGAECIRRPSQLEILFNLIHRSERRGASAFNISDSRHYVYLVPNEKAKDSVWRGLNIAVERGIMDKEQLQVRFSKVKTPEEFLAMDIKGTKPCSTDGIHRILVATEGAA